MKIAYINTIKFRKGEKIMNLRDRLIFLSAESRKLNIAENLKRGEELRKLLEIQGYLFKDTKNYYKGMYENGFVVRIVNEDQAKKVKELAFKLYNQSSVLERDVDGKVYILDKTGINTKLGQLKKVNSYDNLDHYFEIDGNVYTTN